jgi:hypothetical protein
MAIKQPMSERRLVENEVFFRRPNQKVAKGFSELQQLAETEGHLDYMVLANQPVGFFCECADEKCRQKINLKPSQYQKLHQNKKQFVVLPGHVTNRIERVIKSTPYYHVVEKYISSLPKASKLHKTNLHNV